MLLIQSNAITISTLAAYNMTTKLQEEEEEEGDL